MHSSIHHKNDPATKTSHHLSEVELKKYRYIYSVYKTAHLLDGLERRSKRVANPKLHFGNKIIYSQVVLDPLYVSS